MLNILKNMTICNIISGVPALLCIRHSRLRKGPPSVAGLAMTMTSRAGAESKAPKGAFVISTIYKISNVIRTAADARR